MPKGLTGQPCAYCRTGPSTAQGDHVFPRTFFLESKRGDLPKVPACKQCNDEKSRLEHYLATVLPFGGRHADASVNLEEQSFSQNAGQRVSVDLGEGTIRYEGAQGNYSELSVWAISLYGGVVFVDQSQDPADQSTLLYAMTGANEFLRRPAIVAVFGNPGAP